MGDFLGVFTEPTGIVAIDEESLLVELMKMGLEMWTRRGVPVRSGIVDMRFAMRTGGVEWALLIGEALTLLESIFRTLVADPLPRRMPSNSTSRK
jgi:hypothetical protein